MLKTLYCSPGNAVIANGQSLLRLQEMLKMRLQLEAAQCSGLLKAGIAQQNFFLKASLVLTETALSPREPRFTVVWLAIYGQSTSGTMEKELNGNPERHLQLNLLLDYQVFCVEKNIST